MQQCHYDFRVTPCHNVQKKNIIIQSCVQIKPNTIQDTRHTQRTKIAWRWKTNTLLLNLHVSDTKHNSKITIIIKLFCNWWAYQAFWGHLSCLLLVLASCVTKFALLLSKDISFYKSENVAAALQELLGVLLKTKHFPT